MPDISEFIKKNPKIISLIRSIKESDLGENELYQIENSISKKKTKALIIAAGLGSD